MRSTGALTRRMRFALGKGSHNAYMHTGEQQPPTEQKPVDGGINCRGEGEAAEERWLEARERV